MNRNLNQVWLQLKEYYPDASHTHRTGYDSYYIGTDNKNYIQIQAYAKTNTISVVAMKDGQQRTFYTDRDTVYGKSALTKDELVSYFKKVWCEKYYLEDVPQDQQKAILTTLQSHELITGRESYAEAQKALKNYMITGQYTRTDAFISIEIQPLSEYRQKRAKVQLGLDLAAAIDSSGVVPLH